MATGAALSLDMGKVMKETAILCHSSYLPSLEDKELKNKINEIFQNARVGIIYNDGEIKTLEGMGPLESNDEIKNYLNDRIQVIAVRGAIRRNSLRF